MATGGDSPQGSLQIENFECSICLQVYMRPKVLSCGHTFCMECLVSLVRGSKSLKCPTCQKSIKLTKGGRAGVEALIDVISLANLRDDVKPSSGRHGRGLQGAENPTTISEESMCPNPEHRGEELRYYCPRCDAAICEECWLGDHNTHGVTRLGRTLQEQSTKAREVSEEGKRLMEQIRGKITELEKSKRSLVEEESAQVKAVDKTAQKLAEDFASEVIKCANALKNELRNFFAPCNNMILDRKERLETRLAQLASSVEALEKCINQGEAIVVFSGRKMLKDLIEQSSQPTKEELDLETDRHNTAIFTPNPYTLPEITLGKVQEKPKISRRKKETDEDKGLGMGRQQSREGNRSQQVKLNKSENPWKPAFKRHEEKTPEERKTEEILWKVQGILNKLTPQKFQTLCQQVLDLDIVTEERLKGVIDLVFENATTVEKYSAAYANICRCLIHLKVPMKDNPKQTVIFRKLLLNRCQREFEKDKDDEVKKDERMKKIDAKMKMMEVELQREMTKARRRSLGNIRFIGELFKQKMLTENIMHDLVAKLLKSNDEESLECLCRLLTTIGKDLDFERSKHYLPQPRMNQYFQWIDKVIKQKKTSPRVRFMLQEVIELRMNNWVRRRDDNNPKTIDQIHKEAELEETEDLVSHQPQSTPAINLEPRAQKQGIPIQQGRHPHAAPSPHDMNKGQVGSQGPPPVVGTPPTGPSPGPQMSQQTQMYASVSMSQGHRSSQRQFYGPTMPRAQPIQTSAGDTMPKQTVTSAPPPQMFQHPNQMIPSHVPQQAYPQPTLFVPQQYRPQAIPHFQPPQPTIRSATAYFQPVAARGSTQATNRTDFQSYGYAPQAQTMQTTQQQRPPSMPTLPLGTSPTPRLQPQQLESPLPANIGARPVPK